MQDNPYRRNQRYRGACITVRWRGYKENQGIHHRGHCRKGQKNGHGVNGKGLPASFFRDDGYEQRHCSRTHEELPKTVYNAQPKQPPEGKDEEVTNAAENHHRYSQQHGARCVGGSKKGAHQQVKQHGRERVGADHQPAQIGRYPERLKVIKEIVEDGDITEGEKYHHTQA